MDNNENTLTENTAAETPTSDAVNNDATATEADETATKPRRRTSTRTTTPRATKSTTTRTPRATSTRKKAAAAAETSDETAPNVEAPTPTEAPAAEAKTATPVPSEAPVAVDNTPRADVSTQASSQDGVAEQPRDSVAPQSLPGLPPTLSQPMGNQPVSASPNLAQTSREIAGISPVHNPPVNMPPSVNEAGVPPMNARPMSGNAPQGNFNAPPQNVVPQNVPLPVEQQRPLDARMGNMESRGLRFRGGRTEMPREPRGGEQRGNDQQRGRMMGRARHGAYEGDVSGGMNMPHAPNGRQGAQPMQRGQHMGQRDMMRGNAPGMPRENGGNGHGQRGHNQPQRGEHGRNEQRHAAREERHEQAEAREAQSGRRPDYDMLSLEAMNLGDLQGLATEFNVTPEANAKKSDLVLQILEAQAAQTGNTFKQGILDILPDGRGFLRTDGYLPGNEDVYVSQSQIKRFNLKTGDMVAGAARAPKDVERYYSLLRVEACNGEAPDINRTRKEFEKLTPIFPNDKFILETEQHNVTARIVDLVSPIGMGQRGLIVAPPKAGKTSLIKNIANSIMANHPEVYLIVLLIDERPEEVTDISRSVRGEVVASTFDEMPENHIRVADMVLEKAKRMVEQKKDVIILLDSITRLSRASNLVVTPSGRTMSGGLDPAAMHKPKRLFGAARNIEEGGSLTILATVLIDTGSRMDEYIFEELKGTGNMDLVLDRSLFDQRIFPAIDINKSGTRRDDLLMGKEELAAVYHLRRTLSALDNDKAINLLIDRLKNTKTNDEFMQIVHKSATKAQLS